jgi:hypothetical protein
MDETSRAPASQVTSEDQVTSEELPPSRQSSLLRRAMLLAGLVAACAIVYGLILVQFDLSSGPAEAEFGAPSGEARVRVYLQPIQIDPVNDSLQMRISILPPEPGTADTDRDLLLKIWRGSQIQQVPVRANQPPPEVTLDFDLDEGSVRNYPLDRYVLLMRLAAVEQTQDSVERLLPIHVTAWEGMLGFSVKGQSLVTQTQGELPLQFTVHRTGAVSFFGIAIYGAMIVMSICALAIGSLVFVGFRRIEVSLVGALGAIIFALPALRNTLPGSPPLGVWADVLIFFWAELGAIIALCLFIAAWAGRGLSPPAK